MKKVNETVREFFTEIILCLLLSLFLAVLVVFYANWKRVTIPFPTDLHSHIHWTIESLKAKKLPLSEGVAYEVNYVPYTLRITRRTSPGKTLFFAQVEPSHRTDRQYFVPTDILEYVIMEETPGNFKVIFERLSKAGT